MDHLDLYGGCFRVGPHEPMMLDQHGKVQISTVWKITLEFAFALSWFPDFRVGCMFGHRATTVQGTRYYWYYCSRHNIRVTVKASEWRSMGVFRVFECFAASKYQQVCKSLHAKHCKASHTFTHIHILAISTAREPCPWDGWILTFCLGMSKNSANCFLYWAQLYQKKSGSA